MLHLSLIPGSEYYVHYAYSLNANTPRHWEEGEA